MKKIYVLLIAILPLFAIAQPTLHQSDLPVADLGFLTGDDSLYVTGIQPGGTAVTWDYTTLLNKKYGGAYFVAANTTPYAASFPSATVATFDSSSTFWSYYYANSTGFYYNGYDSAGTARVLNPGMLYAPVPFTYGNTRSQTARIEIDTTYLTYQVKIIISFVNNYNADGYGTLMVPGNTFTNTLRINDTEQTIDSIFADLGFGFALFGTPTVSQRQNFRWFRDSGPEGYLLEINADSLGTTSSSSSYWIGAVVLSTPQIASAKQQTVYPNPANDAMHINFGAPFTGTVSVYNSIGEVVKTTELNDISSYTFYVNTYKNGIYHYVLNSARNEKQTGTFVVSH